MVNVLPKIPKKATPCVKCGSLCVTLYCCDCVTLRDRNENEHPDRTIFVLLDQYQGGMIHGSSRSLPGR